LENLAYTFSSDITKEKRLSANLDQIPWPALQKLSPSRLGRTASTLMKEWEKSLSLPLEEIKEPEWVAKAAKYD
jgi:hypothetical protein